MPKQIEIRITPTQLHAEKEHYRQLARKLGISPKRIRHAELLRRSIDARKRKVVYVLRYAVYVDEDYAGEPEWDFPLQQVRNADPVLIVGFGPAGMFAALRLIELGYKPIVLERGKTVRERRRDLAVLNKEGIVDPESNYCFGEGGAGTFSDGKLYTRSKKRGDVRRVLEILVRHGAVRDILVDAHPHIGTNRLPKIIQSVRETILAHGGEIHFETRMEDLLIENGQLTGARCAGGEIIAAKALILATGHSARDIFHLITAKGLSIESKAFALGVRVEHPQALIDGIRYHCETRPEGLPAASYSLVGTAMDRGVYSFCMCPGGIICPASTANDELVVNGWSPSKRNSPFANSGMVVEVKAEDLLPYSAQGPLAGMAFQAEVEKRAFAAGGGAQVAPAQRLTDFLEGKISGDLPECSYLPGIRPADLREVLPEAIHRRLAEGFKAFGQKMKGYVDREAVLVATESRTSSPVRIPRDKESLMHPEAPGLFPCGEGAGYAGGIMSAAMDGERCAAAAAQYLESL